MNPLLYLAGAAGAYFYLKKKAAPIVPMPYPGENQPMSPPPPPPHAAAGTLLGYGGAGNPFYADGAGGIKDASGVNIVTAAKTLLLKGTQYVWALQNDGTYAWNPMGAPSWAPTAASPGMSAWWR